MFLSKAKKILWGIFLWNLRLECDYIDMSNSSDNSGFVEVNNFEKRDTYFIFCYCYNKCFSGTMAFLCSMDVSMV